MNRKSPASSCAFVTPVRVSVSASMPAPASSTTLSLGASTKKLSSPAPPFRVSAPSPPSRTSLPAPPSSVFAPALPVIMLFRPSPMASRLPLPASVRFSTLADSVYEGRATQNRVRTLVQRLDDHVAGGVDDIGVVAEPARKLVKARPAVEPVVGGVAQDRRHDVTAADVDPSLFTRSRNIRLPAN